MGLIDGHIKIPDFKQMAKNVGKKANRFCYKKLGLEGLKVILT